MTKEENNEAAIDMLSFVTRAGYRVEIYNLFVCVDDEKKVVILSPTDDPVPLDGPMRVAFAE